MDRDTATQRIRERLHAGMLPRVIPSLMREPSRPTSPSGNIYEDSSIGVARCSACDDPGAQIAYRFPDGRVLRFHGRCHRIWEEECHQGLKRPDAVKAPDDAPGQ